MERMNDYKKEFDLACEKIVRLEEKNKKLKEENEKWKDTVKTQNEYNKFRIADNERLRNENEELKKYKSMYEGLCK